MSPDELKELKARLGLLEESEACALQDMTLPSLRNQRARGMGPPYTRIGRKVFYPIDKLRAYLAAATVTPTRAPTLIDGSGKRRGRRAESAAS
jgi:hypothetical protein